jgi:hypothetical protein
MTDELLTVGQLARRAGRPPDTIFHWAGRWYLKFPEPRATDPRRWLWDDVARWLAETGRDQIPAREAPKRDYRKVQTCVRVWSRDLPPPESSETPPSAPESVPEVETVRESVPAPVVPESGFERELRLSRERDMNG